MPIYPARSRNWRVLQETIVIAYPGCYQFIDGPFARPHDELVVAQREGVLHRNFRAIRPVAIPICWDGGFCYQHVIGDGYMQNQKELRYYQQEVDERGGMRYGVLLR